MKMKAILFVAAIAVIPAGFAFAELAIDGKSKVGFKATGPGGLKINGKGTEISVTETGEAIVFSVDMNKVSTGIKLRDSHMREKYVETDKFPNAEMEIPKGGLDFPDSGTKSGKVKVTFKAHGQEQETELSYKIKKVKDGYQIEGDFPYNTEQLGIEIPSYLGVTCHPDMTGFATFKVSGQPSAAAEPTEEAAEEATEEEDKDEDTEES